MQPLHVCTLKCIHNDGIHFSGCRLRETRRMRPKTTNSGKPGSSRSALRAVERSPGTSTGRLTRRHHISQRTVVRVLQEQMMYLFHTHIYRLYMYVRAHTNLYNILLHFHIYPQFLIRTHHIIHSSPNNSSSVTARIHFRLSSSRNKTNPLLKLIPGTLCSRYQGIN
jgi:hypothetical protein